MATVNNSKAKFYEYIPHSGEEGKHIIESEADLFIKELSQKQLDTNVTLEQQLDYRKDFQSRHVYLPESTAGVVTFQEFKDLCKNEMVDQSNDISDDSLSENKLVGRHLRELALVVKPNSLETKLLKFAISCNAVGQVQADLRPPDHPINQLKDIEDDRFGYLTNTNNPVQTAKTILRKRQQLLESISDPIEIKRKPVLRHDNSLWDVTEKLDDHKNSKKRLYTCSERRLFTIRSNQIVEMNTRADFQEREGRDNTITERDFIETPERLSEEEIRKLPRFGSYDRGTLNETLYLKNLAPSVTETDLSLLFAKFQNSERPSITYRLLKSGRMRGQAFVNCYCLNTAKEALEGLNGVFLRGKPIIIQYSSSEKKNKPS